VRRRYKQINGKFVEISGNAAPHHHFIRNDIKAFVSPVDGSVIGSSKDLENHNKRNNVVLSEEYGNEAQRISAERNNPAKAKAERIESLKHAVDVHRNNEYSTYSQYVENISKRRER
jgi:hypothetical protein